MAQFFRYPAGSAVTIPAVGTNGATAPTSSIEVGGINPSGNLQPLQTNAAGALLTAEGDPTIPRHVIVDSSALPTGAATASLQSAGNAVLAQILLDTPPLGQATMANSSPVVIASNQSAIPVTLASSPLPTGAATAANQATEIASLSSIDGKTPALGQAVAASSVPVVLTAAQLTTLTPLTSVTVTQATGTNLHTVVDNFPATQPVSGTVAATQSGTWNITNVSGTVSLPTGASTSSLQTTGNTSLSSIDTKTPALGQALAASSVPVVLTALQLASLAGAPTGRSSANAPARNDYTSTSVTTAAFVQLVASTTSATNLIEVFDSSGQTMALATGAAASEVIQFYIFPGGNGQIPLSIPAGTRISIKAISATASVGEIDLNFYT